jgi:hypothetical protein
MLVSFVGQAVSNERAAADAQNSAVTDTTDASDIVTIETIDGQTVSGNLVEVAADGELVGSGMGGLNIQQVLSIATKTAVQKSNAEVQLVLVDGGELGISQPTIDGESMVFDSEVGVGSLSVSSVRAVLLRDNASIRNAIKKAEPDKDTVIVDSGESLAAVAGVLESLTADKLQLNYKGKSRKIAREKVAAIVVADLGLRSPAGTMATVTLTDGSRVRGSLGSISKEKIQLELTGKQNVSIGREFLSRLDIDSDSIAFLSNLTPIEVSERPQFTVESPWQKNLSVARNPMRMRVGGQWVQFDNGIGVQSFSRLVFANDRGFGRFLCVAGIDGETNGRGDCVMRVEGDGITLWTQRIRGDEEAVEVDVDISGISQVALVVELGEQFDLADHANWARARFLKTE